MPYRRTESVMRRLAARHAAIVAAAGESAREGGMAAVQIAPVAMRAGIAAGTVYRYFPGKIDLIAALLAEMSTREISALRRSADVAPGPLSALSAMIMTFAVRSLRDRRLTYAAGRERDVIQSLTLIALRGLGVADARARGLVVQTAVPRL
jgi:AcrR family transcriptional regulator